jgi:hypothetical protein
VSVAYSLECAGVNQASARSQIDCGDNVADSHRLERIAESAVLIPYLRRIVAHVELQLPLAVPVALDAPHLQHPGPDLRTA